MLAKIMVAQSMIWKKLVLEVSATTTLAGVFLAVFLATVFLLRVTDRLLAEDLVFFMVN